MNGDDEDFVKPRGGIMGVSREEIDAAFVEAAWSAQRIHEAWGVPLVIWRDGKVVEVSPAEFKKMLEDGQRELPAE